MHDELQIGFKLLAQLAASKKHSGNGGFAGRTDRVFVTVMEWEWPSESGASENKVLK